jgi:hypothetical protein
MKTSKLLASTAALALLAGATVSVAQTSGPAGAGNTPNAAPQSGADSRPSAPAERAPGTTNERGSGDAQQPSRRDGNRGAQTEPRDQRGQREQRGQNEQREQRGQRDTNEQRRDRRDAQPRESDRDRTRQGQGRPEERNRDSAGTPDRDRNTGAAPANVEVTTEQRTRIREHRTVLERGRVDRVDFSISVGTAVPRTVRVYDLPAEIVEVVPRYRGFKYVLVRNEIVIIDPRTLEIVAVIDA